MTQTVGIVGREEDLGAVAAFVDEGADVPLALVLEGEPGIGKSTLWHAGVEHARERGFRVLVSRPVEAERSLGHAALGDLLDDVVDETLPALAAPRRRALEVALLRDESEDGPVDPRAVAVAVRDVLQLLGERGHVLVAIDDVQWLDPSSAAALAFALRRLAAPVLVLLTRRPPPRHEPSELEQALAPGRVTRLELGALSLGALHQLLRARLGRTFTHQTLLRIHEQSRGNPFFALELGRAVDAGAAPVGALPLPETLEALLRARVAGLPGTTLDALGLLSALGTAPESLLARAGVGAGSLEPAEAAGVLERREGVVRLAHPLLASLLYGDLGERRWAAHARIAEISDDPLVHARHVALSRDAQEEAVAAMLERAAGQALGRAAPALAAELAEHAVRLTPAELGGDRARRALAAARAHLAGGEWIRARTLATELLAGAEPGPRRAEALVLLSELEGVDRAGQLLEQALGEAAARPDLQAVVHCRLAWATRFRRGLDHARAALELAQQLDDAALREQVRAVRTILGWFAGEPVDDEVPALLGHLPDALGGERLVQEATLAFVNTLAPASTRDEARALLEREHGEWRERDEPRAARALWGLAWLELWAGRWERAAAHAAAAHEIAIQYGREVPQDRLPIAVVAVHAGDLERAREHSTRALALAEEQLGFHPPQHLAVLGLVARWSGDDSGALARLDEAERRRVALGWHEATLRWWTGDHVELLLELGRRDEAVALLEAWEADAARVGREWVLAHATRCRGLAAGAAGEVDRSLDLLGRAVAAHDAAGDPFGRARALLALGTARRRARRKRPARDAIELALAGFEAVGATGWADRARAELGRIGGRTRAAGLTPAERRVASLVVEGKTNREVAAALFLGERTVASHLTHAYAKLGVRSRTELARRLGEEPEGAPGKVQTF